MAAVKARLAVSVAELDCADEAHVVALDGETDTEVLALAATL